MGSTFDYCHTWRCVPLFRRARGEPVSIAQHIRLRLLNSQHGHMNTYVDTTTYTSTNNTHDITNITTKMYAHVPA